ncbi:MAG: class II fructose-bisphosphate aldolase [Acidobacteriia bacterium]|nr:class II fructose-bisphosphate aldolase [Terriglobia bacterium]
MPLVNLTAVLPNAQRLGYAVPSFNVCTLEMIAGVLQAAEMVRSPVIIALAERHFRQINPWHISAAIREGAHRAKIPVVLHLDHAASLEGVKLGIELGCTSVMIDGSRLPFGENVAVTRKAVEIARAHEVSVEGELGSIGGSEGEVQGGKEPKLYTNPDEAAQFALETGVDALAVAIGTVHGLYRTAPQLQFELLEQIRRSTEAFLVLHGGTSLPDSDFARLIERGITKINIFTELSLRSAERIRKNLERSEGAIGITESLEGVTMEIAEAARRFFQVFRGVGRSESLL